MEHIYLLDPKNCTQWSKFGRNETAKSIILSPLSLLAPRVARVEIFEQGPQTKPSKKDFRV